MNKILTETIKKKDIAELATNMINGYREYPTFSEIIKDSKVLDSAVYRFTYTRILINQRNTYVNKDLTATACVIRPGDRSSLRGILSLIKDPVYLLKSISFLTPRNVKALLEYSRVSSSLLKKHFDPKHDFFVKAVWLDPTMRGFENLEIFLDDIFSGIIHEDNVKVFFETDSKKHVRLYRRYGAKVCDSGLWRGHTHTLMCIDKGIK